MPRSSVRISPLTLLLAHAAVTTSLACQPPPPLIELRIQAAKPPPPLDPRRSLVVTEQVILQRFSFQRVMQHLVARAGLPVTALQLYRQWWDTQNPGPSLALGPHCDDLRDSAGYPLLNAYPYDCRPEGAQAFEDPFAGGDDNPAGYLPIGLFNRFDLAPADGSHCGEHRIVFARRQGVASNDDRNLVILEAVMPNPHPQQGLKGCQKLVRFWGDLSKEDDPQRRAADLEKFYFQGVANLPPVLDVDHLGAGPQGWGQIRSNQFLRVPSRSWSLREFKLSRGCGPTDCPSLLAVPVTVKSNPFGPLFTSGGPADPQRVAAFQQHFAGQLGSLAADTVEAIDMVVPDVFNSGQSHASGSNENRYLVQLNQGDGAFAYDVAQALGALSPASGLTVENVVARAQALSCAGCHRLNDGLALGGGLTWPSSLGFVHVSEQAPEPSADGLRYRISDALTRVFLPRRLQVLEDFLADKPPNAKHPKDPIGGRRVH